MDKLQYKIFDQNNFDVIFRLNPMIHNREICTFKDLNNYKVVNTFEVNIFKVFRTFKLISTFKVASAIKIVI